MTVIMSLSNDMHNIVRTHLFILHISQPAYFMYVIYVYLENYSTYKHRTSTTCTQEPVDFTHTNIVETPTCSKTTSKKRQISLSDYWLDSLMFSRAPWCSTATKIYCKLGRSWGMVSMLKSFQKHLQGRQKQPCLKIGTPFRRLMYFGRPFYRF